MHYSPTFIAACHAAGLLVFRPTNKLLSSSRAATRSMPRDGYEFPILRSLPFDLGTYAAQCWDMLGHDFACNQSAAGPSAHSCAVAGRRNALQLCASDTRCVGVALNDDATWGTLKAACGHCRVTIASQSARQEYRAAARADTDELQGRTGCDERAHSVPLSPVSSAQPPSVPQQ